MSNDYFAKFGKKLIFYLEVVIKTTSSRLKVIDEANRIKDHPDYLFTAGLANQWLKILGERPTFMNQDKKENGIRLFDPSPFQAFVKHYHSLERLDRKSYERLLNLSGKRLDEH